MSSVGASSSLRTAANEALRRRDLPNALRLLAEAEAAEPGDVELKLQKATALRASGDLAGAIAAVDAALDLDPYNFVALLGKGALIERAVGEAQSADTYRNALKIAPAEVPAPLRPAVARARDVVARTADALEAFLEASVAGLAGELGGQAKARFAETLRAFAGKGRIYTPEPLMLHYSRLPAIPFHDRDLFPWLPKLEAATDTIRGELEALLAQPDEFAPYIAYPPGAPVNQWGELNHSERWSSAFLWRDGERQDQACARCPKTAALMDELPLARQPGFAPTVVFSALQAKTHIPPHTGSTNARLLCHLPLILPGPARFRVGGETRDWKLGEAWVFDDTIEHEAWNDADALRVILIVDVWNPYLEPAEREMVSAMLLARNQFFGG